MLCFPAVEDVRLGRSPLKEVICQVRFPAILRIVQEQPVEFQERVRSRFPELKYQKGLVLESTPFQAEKLTTRQEPVVFRFSSADGHTTVSLSAGFYAISTSAYTRWPDFADALEIVTEAVDELYKPSYAQRIGLRYVNHLTFANTGTRSIKALWGVVRPTLTAMLRQDCWDDPQEMLNRLVLRAEAGERLTLLSGYGGEPEPFFVLDMDYFVEGELPLDQVHPLTTRFHDIIYRAFRWCIREGQLKRFQPEQE